MFFTRVRSVLNDVLVFVLVASSTVVAVVVGTMAPTLIQSRTVLKTAAGDISLLWIACARAG